MSLAFNSNGTQLCALNGGANNGVRWAQNVLFTSSPIVNLLFFPSCFGIDSQQGLVAQPNTSRSLGLNQTTPPNGPAGTTSQIIFSEDNSQLVVSVKGIPPQPGFFAIWDVASNGSLSQNFTSVAPDQGGGLPFSMTIIEGQNALLATDPAVGFEIVDLANFSSNNRSSVVPIPGQGATCWSSHSPKTGNFYLTDIQTSFVTEVHVDNNLNATIIKVCPDILSKLS
jgi:hypothetical protein